MEIIFLLSKRKCSVYNFNIWLLMYSKGCYSVGNEISVFFGGKVFVLDKIVFSVNFFIWWIWVKDI